MDLARVDVGLSGMGSTAVVGVVRKDQLRLCSVGDSRVYLCRQNELRQLTVDDTLVQGLVSAGGLTTGGSGQTSDAACIDSQRGDCASSKNRYG